MTSHRSRSRSPDSSKRLKISREDDRRHEYRYEDEGRSRSRYNDRSRDHRPQLYRVDDRDSRRDDSRSRYRDSDRDRLGDSDRKQHRAHYEDDDRRYKDRERHRERDRGSRDRDRDRGRDERRDERDRDTNGRRANGASPRHGADKSSRSPRHSVHTSRTASPVDVCHSPVYTDTQKTQMLQRQRLEKMELWKKRKAAEAAAKSAEAGEKTGKMSATSTVSATINHPTTGSSSSRDSRPIPVFGFTRANKTAGNQSDLDLEEEEASRRKLEMLPSLTAEDQARINAAAAAEDLEDQDIKLDDDDEEARKHMKREDTAMDIDEGDRLPHRPVKREVRVVDDEDPLDAFMRDVDQEARMIDEVDMSTFGSKTGSNTRVLMGESDDDGPELNSDGELPEQHYASAAKRANSKEVATVDHSKVKYEPFKKDFYIPPPEYRDLTNEEILDLRLELSGITIRGKDCPVPVTKWSQCGLNATVLDVVNRLGYEKPTPIQAQAIPAVMSGRDVIGVAQTGSGKTIAFLLPMFRHIVNQRPLDKMEGPISLILSPTRELATQIFKDCKPFLKALGLRAICVYGGPPVKEQIAQLKSGAEIVVCTPGRMIDLLAANNGRVVNLQRVTYIVLDEADRQFDMGFEPQVMKIISNVRPDRQTVLFSATFPKQMEALARKILKRPIEISVGNKSVVAPEIEQSVEVVKEEDKFNRLLGILGDMYAVSGAGDDRALIFVDRQEGADYLLGQLLKRGYPCLSIHGGKDQIDRDQAIADFKAGAVPILTATSVAARGLDVKQLKLVVNYDCPNHMEDYVHRVGRTGRAGEHGKAVTFITPEQNKYAKDIIRALKLSGTPVPAQLDALAADWQMLIDSGRAYAVGSGFGGKGLDRFDQDRAAHKRLQRLEHGDEDDEEKIEDVFDEDGERKVTATSANGVKGPQDKAVADAVSKVHQVLHSKGQLRTGVAVEQKVAEGPTTQILEINDLAQKARWAVTNRTNIAKVLDQTGVSITTKGSFFPVGRLPGPGEAKLHLLVEGETAVQVESAMRELRRLLSEASDAAMVAGRGEAPTGRYNVMG